MICKISNVQSFKGYIPITYFAKNSLDGEYNQITQKDNIRKCQSFVVRNLNRTAKNLKDENFINLYAAKDKDYRETPSVCSVYDLNMPVVYMVTGKDVYKVKTLARPIGKAKSESIYKTGHSKSFEAKNTVNTYFKEVKKFLNRSCKQVSTDDGKKLALRVYFDPQYTKKGKIKSFKYADAKFIFENETA